MRFLGGGRWDGWALTFKPLFMFGLLSCVSGWAAAEQPAQCQAHGAYANKLWQVVQQACLDAQVDSSMCVLQGHSIVFKTNQTPPHYLLIPSTPLSGIEAPALWNSAYPAYFSEAWRLRYLAGARLGTRPAAQIGIALNSACNRTQNQLHVHMNCIKPSVLTELHAKQGQIQTQWRDIVINQQPYRAKRMPGADIPNDLLSDIAQTDPDAARHPDQQTLFAALLRDEYAVVLWGRYQAGNDRANGHAEDLLSDCGL